MNSFLEKHGYFLEQKDKQVIIHSKSEGYGCIHILFIFLLIPTVVLTVYFIAFALALAPLVFFYFMEVDKRKKHAKNTVIDFEKNQFIVNSKKKQPKAFHFAKASAIVVTSDHIGGYASADRDTTEEYRREVNAMFSDGEILTLFSYVSDYEEEEPEVAALVQWLEETAGIRSGLILY